MTAMYSTTRPLMLVARQLYAINEVCEVPDFMHSVSNATITTTLASHSSLYVMLAMKMRAHPHAHAWAQTALDRQDVSCASWL